MLSCPQLRSCTCFCRPNSSSCARNLGSSNVFAPPGFRDFIVFEKHDVKVHERLDSDDMVSTLCMPAESRRKESELQHDG